VADFNILYRLKTLHIQPARTIHQQLLVEVRRQAGGRQHLALVSCGIEQVKDTNTDFNQAPRRAAHEFAT